MYPPNMSPPSFMSSFFFLSKKLKFCNPLSPISADCGNIDWSYLRDLVRGAGAAESSWEHRPRHVQKMMFPNIPLCPLSSHHPFFHDVCSWSLKWEGWKAFSCLGIRWAGGGPRLGTGLEKWAFQPAWVSTEGKWRGKETPGSWGRPSWTSLDFSGLLGASPDISAL